VRHQKSPGPEGHKNRAFDRFNRKVIEAGSEDGGTGRLNQSQIAADDRTEQAEVGIGDRFPHADKPGGSHR
jgi:hypothetical protein